MLLSTFSSDLIVQEALKSDLGSIFQVRIQDVQLSFVLIVLVCLIAFLYALLESHGHNVII